jgi:hypothetical protein
MDTTMPRRHAVRVCLCLMGVLALTAGPVPAFETVLDKPYGEEWRDVSPELADDVPAIDFWKTLDPKIPEKYFYYRPSAYLFALRYPISTVAESNSREFRLAVKAFWHDIGAKPTGVLTVAQYITLEDRAAWLRTGWVDPWFGVPSMDAVPPGGTGTAFVGSGGDPESLEIYGVLAPKPRPKGTDRTMITINARCTHADRRCIVSTVGEFWFGAFGYDAPLEHASIPEAETEILEVTEWSDERIVAAARLEQSEESEAASCLMILSPLRKVVLGYTERAQAADPQKVPPPACVPEHELDVSEPGEDDQPTSAQSLPPVSTLYSQPARRFVVDWKAKREEYRQAIRAAKGRAKRERAPPAR